MVFSFTQLITGKTEAEIFADLLAAMKSAGLPTTDWHADAPQRVVLEHGVAPASSKIWKAIGALAKSGLIRLARQLAEEDLATWEANPLDTFLGLLAQDIWQLSPYPPAFTEGTVRFINGSATLYNLNSSVVVSTTTGLRYRVAETAAVPLPGGATVWVKVKGEAPGPAYNVAAGAISRIVTSMPGVTCSNQPLGANPSWITIYGTTRESPAQVEARCVPRWARLSRTQAAPADAYVSLALDAHPDVRKVAVWSNYSHALANYKANAVTLYLGSETGPVAAAVAAAVATAISPYLGLHDVLESQPCATTTYQVLGTISVLRGADINTVRAAVEQAFIQWKRERQIGEVVLAWQIRKRVGVAGVVNFAEALTDFTPAKNALVDFDLSLLVYQVA